MFGSIKRTASTLTCLKWKFFCHKNNKRTCGKSSDVSLKSEFNHSPRTRTSDNPDCTGLPSSADNFASINPASASRPITAISTLLDSNTADAKQLTGHTSNSTVQEEVPLLPCSSAIKQNTNRLLNPIIAEEIEPPGWSLRLEACTSKVTAQNNSLPKKKQNMNKEVKTEPRLSPVAKSIKDTYQWLDWLNESWSRKAKETFCCKICCEPFPDVDGTVEMLMNTQVKYNISLGESYCSDLYDCLICMEVFEDVEEVKIHLVEHVKRNEGICKRCASKVRKHSGRREQLNRGIPRELPSLRLSLILVSCKRCDKQFDTAENLLARVIFVEEYLDPTSLKMQEEFVCFICGARNMSGHFATIHALQHLRTKELTCDRCAREILK